MKSRIDILSIGDTATDAFIQLEPSVRVDDADTDDPRLSLPYGAKIPFLQAIIVPAVANAANAAVSFAKLGLRSALFANIGDDHNGQEILQALHASKVQTQFVRINRGKKTNYHYLLWYKTDRTQLMNFEHYDWHLPELHSIDRPAWIYLSRLGGDTLPLHHQIAKYVKAYPETKLVFQPDRFQIDFGTHKLADIYARTYLVFCNREEAVKITGSPTDHIPELMLRFHKLGSQNVVITDGPDGSYCSDGNRIWSMRTYPDPKPPLERTGAGDAFASTVTAALVLGKPLEEAMRWAPINSMSVVQAVGAQAGLLNVSQINRLLEHAPADYMPKIIEGK